ncbi:hypothetical protein CspeluHIS016_0200220 [Cutaneotrichosporon spelunceum]|uniref:Uncharacterized protein n=1 Tax=Cutaneotrichosporon spelunceum TaxID=1672016 RepID=A0AAD3Y9J2_9TREE|nr:hypothetical protein CspeluHIS016_0200220 [Cutaneotrichosporon spelunceum]
MRSRRSREPSAVSVPAASGGSRLVARLRALFYAHDPESFSSSHSHSTSAHPLATCTVTHTHTTTPRRTSFLTNMSDRRRSWFAKESTVKLDADTLSRVNVPGSAQTHSPGATVSPVLTVDAATLGNVNIPGSQGQTIQLSADQLLRVNNPGSSSSKPNSKTGTPVQSPSTSNTIEAQASDLANINQPKA